MEIKENKTAYYNFSTGLISVEEAMTFESKMHSFGIKTGKRLEARVYERNRGLVRVPFTVSEEQIKQHGKFIARYTRRDNGLDKDGLDMTKMGE